MSDQDTADRLRKMMDTGKLSPSTYRQLQGDPVAALRTAQNDMVVEQNTVIAGDVRDIRNALFGNESLRIEGSIPRLDELEIEFYKYKWMGVGMAALVSGIIALVGIWASAHH